MISALLFNNHDIKKDVDENEDYSEGGDYADFEAEEEGKINTMLTSVSTQPMAGWERIEQEYLLLSNASYLLDAERLPCHIE